MGPVWLRGVSWLALSAGLSLACTPEPASPAAPPGDAAQPTRPAESGAARTLPPGRDVSFAAELAEVEKARSLRSLRPVRGRTIETEALRRHLLEGFHEDQPENSITGNEDLLVALGVVPLDFDLEQTMLALLQSDLAGLYDPKLAAMFVREELEGDLRRATLLHELVHALQDQHYGLEEFVRFQDDGSDRASARMGLAEGDATSAMLEAMLAPMGSSSLDVPDEALRMQFGSARATEEAKDDIPPLLRRSVLAPYLDGLLFVQALRRRGGFAEVDRAWGKPPATSEQLLHLEKYDAREAALEVAIPAGPPGSGFEVSYHDVQGEQSIRVLLEEWLPTDRAAAVAAGWGGDRVAVFRSGNVRAAAWVIVMDDAARATTLARALEAPLGPQATQFTVGELSGRCEMRADRGPWAVARRGARLAWVGGPFERPARPSRDGSAAKGSSARAGNAVTGADCTAARAWLSALLGR